MPGASHLSSSPHLQGILSAMKEGNRTIAAICASPCVVLAANDAVMKGVSRMTCYPSFREKLVAARPSVSYVAEEAVVVDGKVITSQGPGTAIDFALTLIKELIGLKKAKEVASGLLVSPAKL